MGNALTLLGGWDLAPAPLVGLVLAAVLYAVGVRRVGRGGGAPWPRAETVRFGAGLLVAVVAVAGPPAAYDDTFFFAHMTQHILLTLLAAPLLVLGDPVLLLLRASTPAARRRWVVPAYRSRLVGALANPVVGWLLFVGVMLLTHVPGVYDFALEHPVVHDYGEHTAYLVTAIVYFYPLLGPTTGPHHVPEALRVVSLFTVMVPMAFLGFFVYAAGHLDYPFYAHVDRPFGPGPLEDQRLAGALMWSSTMVLSVTWMIVGGHNWLRAEELRTRRLARAQAASSARDVTP